MQIYHADERLRSILGDISDAESLSAQTKFKMIKAYERGGVEAIFDDDDDSSNEDSEEVYIKNGKVMRRVQIEDEDQEYLMDE